MNRSALRLYATAARIAALTVSAWGAMLGLFADRSLVALIHDRYPVMDLINYGVLAVVLLGVADVLWHDIRGRLIWPSFPARHRHAICVLVYAGLGAVWLLKAFAAAGADEVASANMLMPFCLCMAAVCGLVAVAIATESRP